ncbi:MAG: hypothetical protein COV99_10785 [Bacteroidetes bacterium CG12_big_fil_rev_8_21_14_0_65_60_17]|nr:MAG: hypothetical protein COV99_10785 [Bacteroidetes bacterium CG12_big_fil_rev_8_21_14_0_65_60_17]
MSLPGEQIVAAYREGLSVGEIASAFGVTPGRVHRILEQAGLRSRDEEKQAKEEERRKTRQRIMSMARKGFRTITISRMIGMAHADVRRTVSAAYIVSRDHTGAEVLIPRHEKNRIERPRKENFRSS